MIEVKNLTKFYGPVAAVKDISFTVDKGHIYGFLGPNGAGKSTTMNMITGCLAATDGQVTIDGYDIYEDAIEAKKCIGYLPEIPPLYTDMTPFEYLEFVGRAKRIPKKEIYEKIDQVMEKTGITDVADRLIKNLSKGYRQRVGIAQAILGDPDVIILDEPTVGLDPIQILEIRDLIKDLGREHTVILSSHILQEISAVCDYVIMISQGKIVAEDTLENLISSVSETSKLKVETTGSEDAVREAVSDIKGIIGITFKTEGEHITTLIETGKDVDIGDDVFLALRNKNMSVHSMTAVQASLEDVFVKLAGESLDAGAAYAKEKEERKQKKTGKKVIADSDLGPAYYSEKYEDEKQEKVDGSEDKPEVTQNEKDDDDYKSVFGGEEDDK